jgi:hypothetical protein
MRVSPCVPLILTAFLATASTADTTECFSSASAVWGAHPGSHATWRLRLPGHEGTKCWFARGSRDLSAPRIRQVADSPRRAVYEEADRRTPEPTIRASSRVKASAVDAPGERAARSTSQDTLLPTEHGSLSILVWAGRPDAHRFHMGGCICGAGAHRGHVCNGMIASCTDQALRVTLRSPFGQRQ